MVDQQKNTVPSEGQQNVPHSILIVGLGAPDVFKTPTPKARHMATFAGPISDAIEATLKPMDSALTTTYVINSFSTVPLVPEPVK